MKVFVTILQITVYLLVTLVISLFLYQYYQIPSLMNPQFEEYRNDELSFLKTFYLMEEGIYYYPAFKLAREGLTDVDTMTSDIFAWRLPTIFYIWSLFINTGMGIFFLFVTLFVLVSFNIFLLFKRYIGWVAIFPSVLFFIYIADTLRYKTAFLFTEWWGVLFFLLGLIFLLKQNKYLSLIFFSLALLTRELFIIPLITLLIYFLWIKDSYWRWLFLIISFSGIFYLFHIININSLFNTQTTTNLLTRFHNYDFNHLQKMMSFSMRYFVIVGQKTHFLLLLIGLISLIFINFKFKEFRPLLLSVLSLIIVLPIIGAPDNDYWGICFVPLILISVPLLLVRKLK